MRTLRAVLAVLFTLASCLIALVGCLIALAGCESSGPDLESDPAPSTGEESTEPGEGEESASSSDKGEGGNGPEGSNKGESTNETGLDADRAEKDEAADKGAEGSAQDTQPVGEVPEPSPRDIAQVLEGAPNRARKSDESGLSEERIVLDGQLVETVGGERWLAVKDELFMPAPDGLPEGDCISLPQADWIWSFPGDPASVLLLGEVPRFFVWNQERNCWVENYPFIVVDDRESEPLLEFSIDGLDELEVVQLDLFPDIPGEEVLSVGVDGFRVDPTSGEAPVRTGRYGLPVRTVATSIPKPPPAPWEARLGPVPTGLEWSGGLERDQSELQNLGGREVLEEAWDDSIALIEHDFGYQEAPSPEAIHPALDPGREDYEDDEAGDCVTHDDLAIELEVHVVPGGMLFQAERTHTASMLDCGSESTTDETVTAISLLRLRDGRVLSVATHEEEIGRYGGDHGESYSSTVESNTRFFLASAVELGEEYRLNIKPNHRDPEDIDQVNLTQNGTAQESDDWRFEFWEDVRYDDGSRCDELQGNVDREERDETNSREWTLGGKWASTALSGTASFQKGEPVLLMMEGLTHKPVPALEKPREIVKGELFGGNRQRIKADPHGVHILDEDQNELLSMPLECMTVELRVENKSLEVDAEVTATPLEHGLVQLDVEQSLRLEGAGYYFACSQKTELLWHGPSGRILTTQRANQTADEASGRDCQD